MEVETKADLLEWLKLKIEWFETDPDVQGGLIGSRHSCSYYDEAKSHLISLNLIDALDSLGSDPPRVACVPRETCLAIGDQVIRKLQGLLSHLSNKGSHLGNKGVGRPPSEKVANRRQVVKTLFKEGKSLGEISTELKIPVNTVKKDLERLKS